jgi:NADPH-ferrihemoprotein reductase
MGQLDVLDIAVLVVILLATGAYFTKGSLWAVEEKEDRYKNGFGNESSSHSADSRNVVAALEENGKDVIIFYGSQTGTAEDYATRISKEASQKYGLATMTADIEDYDFENLDKIPSDKVIVFVMATYGEGEPTDNAVQFWEFINDEDVEFSEDSSLKNLKYVVFGLGNSTYEHYNFIGRSLDKKLQSLGAHRIGPYGEGDDGAGSMEEDYLAWKEELFPTWQKEEGLEEHEAVYEPVLEIIDSEESGDSVFLGEFNKAQLEGVIKGPFSVSNPYAAPVAAAREMFNSPDRNCIHMEFDLSDSGLKYNTGDHLALLAQNSDAEVTNFLKIFGLEDKRNSVIDVKTLDSTAKVHFPTPTTYDAVIRYHLEINGPVSRQLLSSIAPFAPSEDAKKTAMRLGSSKEEFASKIAQKYYNLAKALDVISEGVAWKNVPFSFIVESVNHLIPRYYSISSSSKETPNTVSITAVVESIQADKESDYVLKGVATNYILDVKNGLDGKRKTGTYQIEGPRNSLEGKKIPMFVRHSNFKLPSNPQKPIIMIGPGTGVAPFRAFVHERATLAAKGTPVGPALLFFGCRSSKEDFLYEKEWTQYSKDSPDDLIKYLEDEERSPLTESSFLKLKTAFSRENSQKVYVQHRLKEHAKLVNKLLKSGAFFYVCGDAQRMARDVQSTLIDIISEQRSISRNKAEDVVKNMRTQNLYQEDVW